MDRYKCTKPMLRETCPEYCKITEEENICVSVEKCLYKERVLTNFEKIRNMDIKQLARFIFKVYDESFDILDIADGDSIEVDNFINWLNKESE